MEVILTVFFEKILVCGKWAILGTKIALVQNPGSILRIFLKFCTMKKAKKNMELILMVFLKKKKSQLGQMDYFDLKMTCSHNSGSTLKIFLKFCKMKGVKRYMKISLMFL